MHTVAFQPNYSFITQMTESVQMYNIAHEGHIKQFYTLIMTQRPVASDSRGCDINLPRIWSLG